MDTDPVSEEQQPTKASVQAAQSSQDLSADSDEWEYEYSTTETETFLLTLDLTNPDLNHDRPRRVKQGPLRTRWINPGLGRNRPGKYLKPATYSTIAGTLMDEAQAAEDEPEVDEDVEEEVENADKDGEADISLQANLQSEIQIVDLHSNNPLITYNGSAFSCHWASHVGTEFLFKAHERDSDIPILRKLNGGVDLLAVNQARIVSDPLELQPRKRKRSPERAFVRGSHIPHTKYLIPIGAHASAKRKDQAVFLERMINMKVEMGETDAVTVVAEKRLSNNRWRPRVKELRDNERKELRDIIDDASDDENSSPKVEAAKQRLQEMDEEDERLANMQPSLGKRRVAARALRRGSKTKEGGEAQSPAPRVDKPRRGRPPKSWQAAKKSVNFETSRTVTQAQSDNADGNGKGVEQAIADADDVNIVQDQRLIEDVQDDEDDGGENFYSAREGT